MTINFTGAGVTASRSGETVEVEIPGTGVTEIATAVSASTYTILATDAGKIVPITAACTVTVPPSFDTGFSCEVFNESSGTVTFTAGSGVTIRSEALNLATQYTGASLVHKGSNVWYIVGKLT